MSAIVAYSGVRFFVSLPLFSSALLDLRVSFFFDLYSTWFTVVVLFIRLVIFFYSSFYLGDYQKAPYFIWGTFLFVVSMLVVINIRDLLFVMLG